MQLRGQFPLPSEASPEVTRRVSPRIPPLSGVGVPSPFGMERVRACPEGNRRVRVVSCRRTKPYPLSLAPRTSGLQYLCSVYECLPGAPGTLRSSRQKVKIAKRTPLEGIEIEA